QEKREDEAAVQIQCWYRALTSRAHLSQLATSKALEELKQHEAAKLVQQTYCKYKTRVEAANIKNEHLEEVRRMASLENWAATAIQALARGAFGREKARQRKLKHMARWKEMYDAERGVNFYYSKVTGEVRWRCPQDFLELLPRQACGNCSEFEAFSECLNCGEFFCLPCFEKVRS
ncbi:unnamed protein product, partial [Discosporangium mesarthrocarpum]